MRKAWLAFAMMATAVLLCAGGASAITNGQPDGNRHPNVGLVNDAQYSDGTQLYYSGTLISPTVFLTAVHCDDGTRVRVTFDSAYEGGDKTCAGTFHADPSYPGTSADSHDIDVVVFDDPIKGIKPAALSGTDSLSALSGNQKFTSVGYGAYEVANGPGGHRYLYDDVRQQSTGTLNAINKTWLRIPMNPSTGNGGTCYGDSDGSNFLGDTGGEASDLGRDEFLKHIGPS